jgi:hypothetical protein
MEVEDVEVRDVDEIFADEEVVANDHAEDAGKENFVPEKMVSDGIHISVGATCLPT